MKLIRKVQNFYRSDSNFYWTEPISLDLSDSPTYFAETASVTELYLLHVGTSTVTIWLKWRWKWHKWTYTHDNIMYTREINVWGVQVQQEFVFLTWNESYKTILIFFFVYFSLWWKSFKIVMSLTLSQPEMKQAWYRVHFVWLNLRVSVRFSSKQCKWHFIKWRHFVC